MSNKITVEHQAVLIEYNDHTNTWDFIINGFGYQKASLQSAKEKVEETIKALALKQRKQFKPISALTYTGKVGRITSVESVTSRSYRHNKEVKIVRFRLIGKDEGATKEEITGLVRNDAWNRAVFERIHALEAELKAEKEKLTYLTNADVPEVEK